jgi:hypothetical protein
MTCAGARRLVTLLCSLTAASSSGVHAQQPQAATALSAQTANTAGTRSDLPPVPFEDSGACPFEGCVYREWVATDAVQVRTARRTSARLAFRLRPGEKVDAVAGVVITIRAGRIQFRKAQDILTDAGPIHVSVGETLHLLTYQGEGFTKAWFRGRVYGDIDISDYIGGYCERQPDGCAGRLLNRPQSVWWIQIRNSRGQVGWTSEPDKFDGKDALG